MKRFLLYLMVVIGLLIPVTVSAYDLNKNLTIYLDVTNFGDFSGKKLQVMVGHGTYSICYEMSKVAGYDNLYSVNIGAANGNTWGGATQLGFMADGSIWGGESNGSSSQPSQRINWSSVHTSVYYLTKNLSASATFTI